MLVRRLSIISVLSMFLVTTMAVPAFAATTYKVKTGDSLYLIAKRFGVTVSRLQANNNLGKRTMIHPGQKLIISKTTTAPKTTTTVSRGGDQRGVISYKPEEVNMLARLITAEAGGESYEAQVAVGAVVINRVQSRIFPNSLRGVIYQVEDGHYQFTPVLNGFINKPATAQSLRAARQALTGYDPTNGALYFFVTGTPNRFLQAKKVSTVIDSITFSY
ncbi:MAG TPA: cell wall hydrolase [Bacillota bacterium]|nr:cell wall hydrolase [Bacillota bacterium]